MGLKEEWTIIWGLGEERSANPLILFARWQIVILGPLGAKQMESWPERSLERSREPSRFATIEFPGKLTRRQPTNRSWNQLMRMISDLWRKCAL